jgi:hypothetical protein
VGGFTLLAVSHPNPGTVYRTPEGQPLLFVRTEQRTGSPVPEHLFVSTRGGVVFQRWVKDMPPELELVIDTEGRKQANEQTWLRAVVEHERDLAFELLKQACDWLPEARAKDLRRRWTARQPPEQEEA